MAAARPRRAKDFSPLSDRSRARLLPDLRVSLAARTQSRNFSPSPGMKCDREPAGRFRSFIRAGRFTWENCEANRREGEEYLRVVLEEAGETRVVGEDLGTVPHYVRPSLRSLGVAAFKIPQWENYDDGGSIPGREYHRFLSPLIATHDHKPCERSGRIHSRSERHRPSNKSRHTWRRSRIRRSRLSWTNRLISKTIFTRRSWKRFFGANHGLPSS